MRTYLHGFAQALPGVGDQFPGLIADVTDEKSLVEVPVKVPVVHCHVHCKTKLLIHDMPRWRERQSLLPLQMSPSCSGLWSGIPWQMTSLTEVQHDLGNW
jgi:hypothetical protein